MWLYEITIFSLTKKKKMLTKLFFRNQRTEAAAAFPSPDCSVFWNKPFKSAAGISDCRLLYTVHLFEKCFPSIWQAGNTRAWGKQSVLLSPNRLPAIAPLSNATHYTGKIRLIFQKCVDKQLFQNIGLFKAGTSVFTTQIRNTYMFFCITEYVSLG